MTTKHPLSSFFRFVNVMYNNFPENIQERLGLYLDYISGMNDEERIKWYRKISAQLNSALPANTNITIYHLTNDIPASWPCIEWFQENYVELDDYDNTERKYAVFDYDIIFSKLESDHKRLLLLLILQSMELEGNSRVSGEISIISEEIVDKSLLSEYGYNNNAGVFETMHQILSDFSPRGSNLLMEVVEKYQSGEKTTSELITDLTNKLSDRELIPAISSEISEYSKKILEDKSLIPLEINKITKTIGISDDVSNIISDVSTELLSKPTDVMGVIASHTQAFTGIDEDSLRGIVKNVRESIPLEELNEIADTVTNAINAQQTDGNN